MRRPDDPIWDRWDEVDLLLERLLEVDATRRASELIRLCRGDSDLERMLRELLAASDANGGIDRGPTPQLVAAAIEEGAPTEPLPDRVGPYRIIGRLGRGGMGSVFLAERDDPSFRNRVALKLLRRGVDTEDVLARFRAERQILASLHHPGIATVFEAGTSDDGRPFLVMEYVEGMPLTRHCDAKRLSVLARLRLFMAVLRAVSHAHGHGVVHRDLKPSNILVTREEAHVKLLDFGIAKLLDHGQDGAGTPPTGPDTRPMTPGFASPEQLLALPIAEASDIYQLGLLLHELLTGRRPHAGHSGREYERRVTTTDPDLPSRTLRTPPGPVHMRGVGDTRELARIVAGDLDAIVLRCLQRDPSARYESVAALHEDVARYLAGRPVAARRATRAYRLEKLVRRRARMLAIPAVAIVAIAASWLVFRGPFSAGPAEAPVRWVATGSIVDDTDPDRPLVARQVNELLVTHLGRSDGLQVVRLPVEGQGTGIERAALQAGASEVIDGVVRSLASGELQLVLRRTDASSGRLLDSARVRGVDAFALVEAATPALFEQYAVAEPDEAVASASTSSPRAYDFYIEGLAAFRAGDDRVADRFFHAALEEDSAFAGAAYYAYQTTYPHQPHAGIQLLNRAYRLAADAPDRERLAIRARWADVMDDPRLTSFADSFVRRFPAEPQAHSLQGQALILAGRFPEAVERLEHAVALDSLSLHAARAPCVACEALADIVRTHFLADSLEAAVRTGERWTRLQPASARSWHFLSAALMRSERYEEAVEARAKAAARRVGNLTDALFPGMVAIHRGDFEEADRVFRLHMRTGTPLMRIYAGHWLAISLRTQGRWNDALEVAEQLLEAARPRPPGDRLDILGQLARALALLGSGRPLEAAEQFEASARGYAEFTTSRISRDMAWYLTHAGTARAAAGDTVALAELVEQVETLGARSLYSRDQRLHLYLRALLARARRAPEDEVERHLRAALYSLGEGFVRINQELAESLLRQQRYEEAAGIATAALHNSMQSNGMYATRTDFHELLGRIWHAAGERDSALVHLRAARDAWRAADSIMRPRVMNIERLLVDFE